MSKSLSKLMKRPHLGATRALGYALTLGDYETWEAASAVWQARLSTQERGALAWAALRSLDHDDALAVAEAVLGGAGAPLPPLFSPVSEAAFWTGIASPAEIDAYALACTRAMAPGRRAAFLEYMREGAAA
jgi:hypothetical protein